MTEERIQELEKLCARKSELCRVTHLEFELAVRSVEALPEALAEIRRLRHLLADTPLAFEVGR